MSATRRCSRGLGALLVAALSVAATRSVDDALPITPAAPRAPAAASASGERLPGVFPCKPGAAFDVTFTEVDAADGFVEVAFDIRPRPPLRDVTWELELVGNVSLVEGAPRDRINDGVAASGRLLLRVPADGTHKTAELVVRDADAAGSNRCGVFFSAAYLRRHLAPRFLLREHVTRGARGNPPQDLSLLQARTSSSPPPPTSHRPGTAVPAR